MVQGVSMASEQGTAVFGMFSTRSLIVEDSRQSALSRLRVL